MGVALKHVPSEHALAVGIRQMLHEELSAALEKVPPDRSLAEKIREILEKFEKK